MTSRISDLSLSQNAIQYLQASLGNVAALQTQASTGKKLTKPSASTVDIGTSLQLRSSLNRNTQLSTNIGDAEGWLGTTDSTLGQVSSQVRQVQRLVLLAVNASNDTKSQNSTNASTMQQNLSNVEDADLAEVLMNLQTQQMTYQAALAAAAKAIQPSLAAFLQ